MTRKKLTTASHKITITMTESQMFQIERAVDFMARLLAGDFCDLAYQCRVMMATRKISGDSGRIMELCRELKSIVRPDLPINASTHKEPPASTMHDIRADILNGYYSQTDEPNPGVYPYIRFGDGEKIKVKVEE